MKARNVVIFGSVALIVMLGIAGYLVFTDYQTKQEAKFQLEEIRNNSLALQLHTRDSLVNDYLKTFAAIEKDLLAIKTQENLIGSKAQDPELKKNHNSIRSDVQLLNDLIQQNKQKIKNLTANLKQSGLQIGELNEQLELLSQAVEERDVHIESLMGELAKMDVELATLNQELQLAGDTIKNQQKMISSQTASLNKAFIASGNFKELNEKGILVKDGGFLGIGKMKTLSPELSDDVFTEVSIAEMNSIPVHSKKATLITEHPQDSYEWITENDTITSMVIVNPGEFWKISKYAVVETK